MANLKKNNNFIERSLTAALAFFKESVLSEEYATSLGFLQRVDPRVKLITFLLFCIAVLLVKNIYLVIFLYLFCLCLAHISRINLIFFLKRTWVFIPLFSLFIAIPALFSFISPGEAVFSFKFFGLHLIITRQGMQAGLLFVARVVASVSFVILLSLTTRHFTLLKVLRVFKVPQIFVMVLGMTYRYIYLFTEIIENTYLALKSRTGTLIHYRKGRKIVAWNIATLWQRSFKLNEDVYSAMLSRGYCGEPVISDEFKVYFKDWAWGVLALAVFSAIIYLNHG